MRGNYEHLTLDVVRTGGREGGGPHKQRVAGGWVDRWLGVRAATEGARLRSVLSDTSASHTNSFQSPKKRSIVL